MPRYTTRPPLGKKAPFLSHEPLGAESRPWEQRSGGRIEGVGVQIGLHLLPACFPHQRTSEACREGAVMHSQEFESLAVAVFMTLFFCVALAVRCTGLYCGAGQLGTTAT